MEHGQLIAIVIGNNFGDILHSVEDWVSNPGPF